MGRPGRRSVVGFRTEGLWALWIQIFACPKAAEGRNSSWFGGFYILIQCTHGTGHVCLMHMFNLGRVLPERVPVRHCQTDTRRKKARHCGAE